MVKLFSSHLLKALSRQRVGTWTPRNTGNFLKKNFKLYRESYRSFKSSIFHPLWKSASVTLTLLFFSFLSLGKVEKKAEPTFIHAEGGIEIDQTKNQLKAYDRASVKRGEATLFADVILAYYEKTLENKNTLKRVEAYGHVRIVMPGKIATSHEGFFEIKQDIIILKGNVHILDKQNEVTGPYAQMDRRTGVTKILAEDPSLPKSTAPKKRVRALLIG